MPKHRLPEPQQRTRIDFDGPLSSMVTDRPTLSGAIAVRSLESGQALVTELDARRLGNIEVTLTVRHLRHGVMEVPVSFDGGYYRASIQPHAAGDYVRRWQVKGDFNGATEASFAVAAGAF